MSPFSNGDDEPFPMLIRCTSSLVLTSLVLFWARRVFSLMTIQRAKPSMTAPWPQSPNITANKKGKVMIVYGAAGMKRQEAQLLLNKREAEQRSRPFLTDPAFKGLHNPFPAHQAVRSSTELALLSERLSSGMICLFLAILTSNSFSSNKHYESNCILVCNRIIYLKFIVMFLSLLSLNNSSSSHPFP